MINHHPNINGAAMKKIIFTILSVSLIVTSFGYTVSPEEKYQEKVVEPTNLGKNEFKEFLVLVIPKDTVFREYYENSRLAIGTEYKALLKEQYEYVIELLKEMNQQEVLDKSEQPAQKIELQYSDDELSRLDNCKGKDYNKIFYGAMKGDAAELYMLGLCHLYGYGGTTISVEKADEYFSCSALLGFAPALDKIKGMYLEKENLFLFMVYLNLTASSGHPEFTMPYHDQRKQLIDKFGISMVKEIERVATEKKMRIYSTINEMEECEDKIKKTLDLLFVKQGIVGEDNKYDMKYWEKFFEKKDNS